MQLEHLLVSVTLSALLSRTGWVCPNRNFQCCLTLNSASVCGFKDRSLIWGVLARWHIQGGTFWLPATSVHPTHMGLIPHAALERSKEWAALTQWLSCLVLFKSSSLQEPPQKPRESCMGQNWFLSLGQLATLGNEQPQCFLLISTPNLFGGKGSNFLPFKEEPQVCLHLVLFKESCDKSLIFKEADFSERSERIIIFIANESIIVVYHFINYMVLGRIWSTDEPSWPDSPRTQWIAIYPGSATQPKCWEVKGSWSQKWICLASFSSLKHCRAQGLLFVHVNSPCFHIGRWPPADSPPQCQTLTCGSVRHHTGLLFWVKTWDQGKLRVQGTTTRWENPRSSADLVIVSISVLWIWEMSTWSNWRTWRKKKSMKIPKQS